MTGLVKYEAARRMLAEAVAVDEVLEIRNQGEAMRAYAQQAKDRDLEIQAAQIRFRAERRLGEIIIAQKETVGLNRGRAGAGRPRLGDSAPEQPKTDERPTLEQAGIDRKLSSRAQRMAAIEPERFEQLLKLHHDEVLEGNNKVSVDLMRTSAEADGREKRRDLAQALSETSVSLPGGRQYPAAYIDCPWARNGGIGNRAYENHYPTMSWPEILTFLRSARDSLLPDSWAYFWIPRAHLLALVEVETEVTIAATGEVVRARVETPLAWACAQALGMDSYSTCFVWTKTDEAHPDDSGSGLIAWDQDELLLLFKRGRGLPKPAGSEKFGSNHRERAREHSRKPEFYRHMIATMVGCDSAGEPLPVLEMFARVDAEHKLPTNWDACGNQVVATRSVVDIPTDATPSSSSAGASPSEPFAQIRCVRGTWDKCDSHADCEVRGDCKLFPFLPAHKTERAPPPAADPPALQDAATQLAAGKVSQQVDPVAVETADPAVPSAGRPGANSDDVDRAEHQALGDIDAGRDVEIAMRDALRDRKLIGGRLAPKLTKLGRARLAALDAHFDALMKRNMAGQCAAALPFDDDAPEIVDGKLQCRLPLDAHEIEQQRILIAIGNGEPVAGDIVRHLVGVGYAHATATRLTVTDQGRAWLAMLVDPPAPAVIEPAPHPLDLPLFLRREAIA